MLTIFSQNEDHQEPLDQYKDLNAPLIMLMLNPIIAIGAYQFEI